MRHTYANFTYFSHGERFEVKFRRLEEPVWHKHKLHEYMFETYREMKIVTRGTCTGSSITRTGALRLLGFED